MTRARTERALKLAEIQMYCVRRSSLPWAKASSEDVEWKAYRILNGFLCGLIVLKRYELHGENWDSESASL
jgi:hypothetical protein